MVLHDFERDLIEEVFGCKVTNRYVATEVSLIASECEAHQGLHVNMDTLHFECLWAASRSSRRDRSRGGHDLTNHGMPFIRYLVGDTARMADKPCTCGRTYPLVASLEAASPTTCARQRASTSPAFP
jgi:phenylacetate-CoA ligase